MFVDRLGIHFGPLTLTFFGLLMVAGLLAGGYLSMRAARERDEDPDNVVDALTWAVILGVVGARIFHVLAPPPSMVAQGLTTAYYLSHPFDLKEGIFAIWAGGLNMLGALVGGVYGVWVFTRRRKLSFPLWADIAAAGVPLGIAVASLGNLVNGQMLGPESDLPWAVTRVAGGARYHPAPAYLSLWALLVWSALVWIGRRFGDRLKPGDLFLCLVALLAPGVFIFESLQADRRALLASLSGGQVAILAVLLGSLLWIGVRHRRDTSSVGAG